MYPPKERGGGGGENVGTEVKHLILSQTGEGNVGTKVGQVAPNFVDEDDNSFSLNGHRGRVVLLDFMAAWYGPYHPRVRLAGWPTPAFATIFEGTGQRHPPLLLPIQHNLRARGHRLRISRFFSWLSLRRSQLGVSFQGS